MAAELIPRLCALSKENTVRYWQQVRVEQVGATAASLTGVEFSVDPRAMASASIREEEARRTWKVTCLCAGKLPDVTMTRPIAGSLPAQPTLLLRSLLERCILHWTTARLLMPVFAVLIFFSRRPPSLSCSITQHPASQPLQCANASQTDRSLSCGWITREPNGTRCTASPVRGGGVWSRALFERHDVHDRAQIVQKEWASHEVLPTL
ncbi:hypothetical protein CUR178_08016 [Leishmania enriettii]|uniref:Uncharacterized protein n=1 Tax=Leishmania enriettii TaxID=5663 RepID=A0A836KTG6_LEIEN|nr:hypothetical protein CUR178_08016 [Leishmania enriettii]